jgi:poly-gamma-glutamate synthesis protein (capsule biosynthesis protein)
MMFDSEGRVGLSGEDAAARVLVAGDLCPINRVETMLAAGDVDGAFADTRDVFRTADLTIVNLESPLCAVEAPIAKLGPNFRADPSLARALSEVPVHVACLANNHMTDQGDAGLAETLAALDEAGIRHVGAGPDQTRAGGPLRLEVGGVSLALLDFAVVEGAIPREGPGAARIDHLVVRRAVAEAAAGGDAVIPTLHAGKEGVLFPSPGLQALCRELVDAGAAAVICHHPHVPQGIEVYRDRPIAYSLGNFLFDWPEPEMETDSSFLLELGLGGAGVVEFRIHPFRKSAGGGAELLRGEARANYLEFIAELCAPLADEGRLRALWREQCRVLLDSWYKPRLARGALLSSDDPDERRRAGLTFLNLMENDEHGAVLKQALLDEVTGVAAPDADARGILDGLMDRLKSFTVC